MSLWELEIKQLAATSIAKNGREGLRSQVWGAIGEGFGRAWGEILGAQMDTLVIATEQAIKKAVASDGKEKF